MRLVAPKVRQQRLRGGLALKSIPQNAQHGMEVGVTSAVEGEAPGRANATAQRRAAFNGIPNRPDAVTGVLAIAAEPLGGKFLLRLVLLLHIHLWVPFCQCLQH